MNEKLIEKKLREKVKMVGGKALKLSSPYYTGLPDRLILMPGGKAVFAEIKTTGKKPTKRQDLVIGELRELGFKTEVIDSEQSLQKFIDDVKRD